MSHVDEGALHAYLDGALEEYPSGQARRIRTHLERCGLCAEALAEARRARDVAERIMATPELGVVPPPLEELKRLARSSEPPERRMRVHRLGWAASVVLALGTGWMLRGGSVTDPAVQADRTFPAVESVGAPIDRSGAAASARVAEVDVVASDVAARAPSDLPSAPEPLRPPTTPALEVAPVLAAADHEALVDDVLADGIQAERLATATGAPTGAEPAKDAAEEARVAELTVAEPTPSPLERSTSSPVADAQVALSSRAEGGTGLMGTAAFDRTRSGPARASGRAESEPGSLVVPGLEVLSIVWREEGVTPAGVRVLQRLEDGSELELIHLPEGFEPGLVEGPGPGVAELVVPREQGWLILRATVDEDALVDLLRRLDEAPPI